MKYFTGITTLDELKAAYRRLAMKHHRDARFLHITTERTADLICRQAYKIKSGITKYRAKARCIMKNTQYLMGRAAEFCLRHCELTVDY